VERVTALAVMMIVLAVAAIVVGYVTISDDGDREPWP
jgi:hypothetical protein